MVQATSNADRRYFIIEGNIGAGKSTFLKMVHRYLTVHVIPEPHDRWQRVGGDHNLLGAFYVDPSRWAYSFQSYAFVTRVMIQQEHAGRNTNPIHVLERSVFSDRYCFAKNCFELGYMNALEWKLYQEWFTWLVMHTVPKPAGFIYLRTTPEICHTRLTKRNREEEVAVPLTYLQALHTKHEDWLLYKHEAAYLADVPVLIIDCDKDFEHDEALQQQHVAAMVQFFNEHAQGMLCQRESINSLRTNNL